MAATTGGPSPWNGKSLKEIHANMAITTAHMDKYVALFKEAAIKAGRNPT
jgi:truncated hemoglobin YjbI